jgi:hypothetical protein
MKWPGSTLTDSRSRYHGKNEREGRAEPGQARRLINGSGSDEGNGSAVARRVFFNIPCALSTVQTCPGGGDIFASVAREAGAQFW